MRLSEQATKHAQEKCGPRATTDREIQLILNPALGRNSDQGEVSWDADYSDLQDELFSIFKYFSKRLAASDPSGGERSTEDQPVRSAWRKAQPFTGFHAAMWRLPPGCHGKRPAMVDYAFRTFVQAETDPFLVGTACSVTARNGS